MLYLSAIVLAFFFAFILITKRNKTPGDYILFGWLTTTGFHLLTFYLFATDQQSTYPTMIVLGFPLPLAQGPFLYLYTRQQTSTGPFKKARLLHFLPVLLSYLLFSEFYFLSFDQKVQVFQQKGQTFLTQSTINLYAIYISGILYALLSLSKLLRYRRALVHQFSNTDKIHFNWLLYLIIWLIVIWLIVLFVGDSRVIHGTAAVFVLWLGYFGTKQVQIFSPNSGNSLVRSSEAPDIQNQEDSTKSSEESKEEKESTQVEVLPESEPERSKYLKSTLSENDVTLIHERLMSIIKEQKPYKNPNLTLNELAKILDVHPNHLSQVINSKEKKSFYDLINEKRVEEFIRMVSDPSFQQYTLLAISYDCGFNSKASFNRNFKKYTGQTPSDYLKQQATERQS